MKNIWKHLRKAPAEHRREIKSAGEKEKNSELTDLASELWKMSRSPLKKPSNIGKEEREQIEQPENRDAGFIKKFRSAIRQTANIFDHSNAELQAEIRPENLKRRIGETENKRLGKICRFFDGHWDQAMQYFKKRGLAKCRRSSSPESGMRILRRPEKNHDGIRSEAARKNYIKIYQVIKYLSEDITDFLDPVSDS